MLKTRVNTNISDLFFNRDLTDARLTSPAGRFEGYREDVLLAEAQDMLNSLTRLGVFTPEAEDVVADFLSRV